MSGRTMAELVNHYYLTKKEKVRVSYIERERIENAIAGVENDPAELERWYEMARKMDEKTDVKVEHLG